MFASLISSIKRAGRRHYFAIALAPLFAAALAAYSIAAVDPYDLRPWGAKIALTDEIYPQTMVPRLVSAAAHSGKTHIIAGGSSILRVRSETMRTAFGSDTEPFNLAFAGIRPADLRLVLDKISQSDSIKRVIATIDGTMLAPAQDHRPGFPADFYTMRWDQPAADFGLESLYDAVLVVRYGTLSRDVLRGRPMAHAEIAPLPERAREFERLKKNSNIPSEFLLRPTTKTCANIDSIAQTFIPTAQRYSARGLTLDLLIPPYSLAGYADIASRKSKASNSDPPPYFSELMLLRRCVIEAVSPYPNVRVHGFDTDWEITADLMNYRDTTHIQKQEVYLKMMQAIAAGTHVLTRQNWPQYEQNLRDRVAEFKLSAP